MPLVARGSIKMLQVVPGHNDTTRSENRVRRKKQRLAIRFRNAVGYASGGIYAYDIVT